MNKYYSIASGSKGNCGLLITNEYKILIDVGVSFKFLKQALGEQNIDILDIDYVFITHEHADHVKGLAMLSKNTQIPVHICKRCFDNIADKEKIITDNIIFIDTFETINKKNLKVETFKTPHDSVESVGFKFTTNQIIFSYVTDLGYMPNSILNTISNSNMVVLECNYNEDFLKSGDYPQATKNRIMSNEGHLSNDQSCQCIVKLLESGVCKIMLAHLSENNNSVKSVCEYVNKTLEIYGISAEIGKDIHIATPKNYTEMIEIK